MNSYADALESYLIPAEEGFMDVAKKAVSKLVDSIKALIAKIIAWVRERKAKFLEKNTQSEKSDPGLNRDLHKFVAEYSSMAKYATEIARKMNNYISDPTKSSYIDDQREIASEIDKRTRDLNDISSEINEKIESGKRITSSDAKELVDIVSSKINEIKNLHSIMTQSKSTDEVPSERTRYYRLIVHAIIKYADFVMQDIDKATA